MAKIEVFIRKDMQNLGYIRLDKKASHFIVILTRKQQKWN